MTPDTEPKVDIRFRLRRLYYDARSLRLYGLPEPPDFAAMYQDAQERWERRQSEMRAGIVSLDEYRRNREGA